MVRLFHCLTLGLVSHCSLLLAGCNTVSYQPDGLRGGYSDVVLANSEYRVTYQGNGDISSTQALDFALLRASVIAMNNQAELAIANEILLTIETVKIDLNLPYIYKPTARLTLSLKNDEYLASVLVSCDLIAYYVTIKKQSRGFAFEPRECISRLKTKYKLPDKYI
ncbi:CC0125/CC1285 family lipoprotein (plasmid) [Pseudoalteromonas lipolytica]|uniref:CC0125/CC1285 family lipoprotein n=1 Tax=Pseudoalteromonas lipolytica TaxID=570156 RepID=UPI003B9EDB68